MVLSNQGKQSGIEAEGSYDAAAFLAAIVESSDDAIVSKTLAGIITTWNKGAERIFGYTADEAVGRPVTIIIPEDRLDEEPKILARIQAGERVDHFETVRRRKDGTLIDISLTISPIRNNSGQIIGASKIARDISDLRREVERREILLREMQHRIKNLFLVVGSIITLAARNAATPTDLASSMKERLMALSRAHAITLPTLGDQTFEDHPATLFQLLSSILAPYGRADHRQWSLNGEDVDVGRGKITNVALLFHEIATNAAKYGALSVEDGTVAVTSTVSAGSIDLIWLETGGTHANPGHDSFGFGHTLEQGLAQSLNIKIERTWLPAGLKIRISLPRAALS